MLVPLYVLALFDLKYTLYKAIVSIQKIFLCELIKSDDWLLLTSLTIWYVVAPRNKASAGKFYKHSLFCLRRASTDNTKSNLFYKWVAMAATLISTVFYTIFLLFNPWDGKNALFSNMFGDMSVIYFFHIFFVIHIVWKQSFWCSKIFRESVYCMHIAFKVI